MPDILTNACTLQTVVPEPALWLRQVSGASELGKRMSKEDSENLLAHLVYTGTLNIDFGHTAYATNVYLRCAQRAGQSLDGRAQPTYECVCQPCTSAAGHISTYNSLCMRR